MIGPGDVTSALDCLELGLIEQSWVSDVWKEKFENCPEDLPDEFAEKFSILNANSLVEVFKQSIVVIGQWLKPSENDGIPASESMDSESGPSWTALQDIDYKALLALIFFNVKKAQANYQNLAYVELGFTSAAMYFALLSIPGSSIYQVFQITLFEPCLEMFSFYKYVDCVKTPVSQKGRKNTSLDDDSQGSDAALSQNDQVVILKRLISLMRSFQTFTTWFSFRNHSEAMKMSLSLMADLTRFERSGNIDDFSCRSSYSAQLTREAYNTLTLFCAELHGGPAETIRLVLYRVMPNLTLEGGSNFPEMKKWAAKESNIVRANAAWFVINCIIPLGNAVYGPLKILIQHMCRSLPERADVRAKGIDVTVSLLSYLPQDTYYSMLRWIFRETLTDGVNHRVVGLELLSKLIYLKQGTTEQSNMAEACELNLDDASVSQAESAASALNVESMQAESSELNEGGGESVRSSSSTVNSRVVSFCTPIVYVPIEYRRAMLLLIIYRLLDDSANARGRAMAILCEIVSNKKSPTITTLVRDVFVTPYEAHSKIDLDQEENVFVNWKQFVAGTEQISKPSIYKTIAPGARSIVRQLIRLCENERVLVRRYALALLKEIFKLEPKWMNPLIIQAFCKHCRDPAMSIRKDMVTFVTELMIHFPDKPELSKLWVTEVLPRINDREIRVQEHTVQVLTNTILAPIRKAGGTMTPAEELPWNLLSLIANNKMRCFLTDACLHWKSNKELNLTRISQIMSHIGQEFDAPAWVLLASISEYIDIDRPQAILRHYVDVVSVGEGNHGTYNLVLLTLKNSWHCLSNEHQNELKTVLITGLREATIAPDLIQFCVDIATALMVSLASNKELGKKDVAKWTIDATLNCESHLMSCLEPSKSPCPQCLYYLILLGSLSDLHPDGIRHDTYHHLSQYLMTSATRDEEQLKVKAALIIALGRMANREKYIASRLVGDLAKILTSDKNSIVLNNVVVAVADIGTRFPSLIEPLVSSLSLCLRHPKQKVRDISLVMVIDLLQEEYLKSRGAIVMHLLSLTVDSVPRTVAMVKYFLTTSYLAKLKQVDSLLVDALFHFNRYHSFPNHPKMQMTSEEEAAFDLSGPKRHKYRMAIYKFLLKHFNVVGKLKSLHFICNSIMNGAAEQIISIEEPLGEQLLFDVLKLLASKDMSTKDVGKKKGDDEEDEDSQQKKTPAEQDLVIQAFRKQIITDTVIPICIKLRKTLSMHKLRTYLYRFVREVVREYKSEINDLFREDRQFGQEILYEIDHPTPEQDEQDSELELLPSASVIKEVREGAGLTSKRKSDEMNINEPDRNSKKLKSSEEMNGKDSGQISEEIAGTNQDQEVVDTNMQTDSVSDNAALLRPESVPPESSGQNPVVAKTVTEAEIALKNCSIRLELIPPERLASMSPNVKSKSQNSSQPDAVPKEPQQRKGQRTKASDQMLPPAPAVARGRNSSRRVMTTPSVPKSKAKLFSSTPVVTTETVFEDTNISPVVQLTQSTPEA